MKMVMSVITLSPIYVTVKLFMHPSLLYNCHSDDVTRSNETLVIKHFKFISFYCSIQSYLLGNNLPS